MKHLIRLLPPDPDLGLCGQIRLSLDRGHPEGEMIPGADTKSKEVFPMVKREAELSRQFNEQMKGGAEAPLRSSGCWTPENTRAA